MVKKSTNKRGTSTKKLPLMYIQSGNRGRGYHGEVWLRHKGDKKLADKTYNSTAQKVMKTVGEKDPTVIKHYLDSVHGRFLRGRESKPAYIKLDFARFRKSYKPDNFYTEESMSDKLDEAKYFKRTKRLVKAVGDELGIRKPNKYEQAHGETRGKRLKDTLGHLALQGTLGAGWAGATLGKPLYGAGVTMGAGLAMQLKDRYKHLKAIGEERDFTEEEIQELQEIEEIMSEQTEVNLTEDLIRSLVDKKPATSKEILDKILGDKITNFLDDYKSVLAKRMFGESEEDSEDGGEGDDEEIEVEEINLDDLTDEEIEEILNDIDLSDLESNDKESDQND